MAVRRPRLRETSGIDIQRNEVLRSHMGARMANQFGSILMSVIRTGYAPTQITRDFTNVVYLSSSECHVQGN